MKCNHFLAKGISRGKILFVHGAWHGAWCWEEYFTDYFTDEGYDCFTFDLVGHDKPGKVEGINRYLLRDYVNDLHEAVDEVGEDVVIVGHSMGGLILQKYLEDRSCFKAVLLATAPYFGVLRTTFKFLFSKSYSLPAILMFNLYALVDQMPKSKWAFFSKTIEETKLQRYTHQLSSESYLAFLGMLYPRVKRNFHTKIPMLVLGAENDNIFSSEEMMRTAERYEADLLILPDIAHDMMLDVNYQQTADALLRWIKEGEVG